MERWLEFFLDAQDDHGSNSTWVAAAVADGADGSYGGQTVMALSAFQTSRGIYTFLLYLSNHYSDSDSKTLRFNGHTAAIYGINLFLSTPF